MKKTRKYEKMTKKGRSESDRRFEMSMKWDKSVKGRSERRDVKPDLHRLLPSAWLYEQVDK
jgi:hypothetical protein